MAGEELSFRVLVPAQPLAVTFVRKAVATLVDMWEPATSDLLPLVASELVTNAIRHGVSRRDGSVEVLVRLSGVGARIEVTDPGDGFEPHPDGPQPGAEGGYGLFIVDRTVRRWGVDREGDLTRVWAEL